MKLIFFLIYTDSSWKVGVFLLVNTALGAGILNYPAAYDRLGGIVISTLLQFVCIMFLIHEPIIIETITKIFESNPMMMMLNFGI